jgi:type IV pilus assembly protein PilW
MKNVLGIRRLPRVERGMSLVELMVGMLIGLIGIVIITHLYVTNEQYKRSTTGSGTAQVNGAIALYTLERDVRMAGYGVNHSGALGCSTAVVGGSPIQYYYEGQGYSNPPLGGSTLPPLILAPVVIGSVAGQPDSITLLYSTAAEGVMPTKIDENMPQPSSEFKVDGTAGFKDGDLVVVAQGATCALAEITNVQTSASKLQHNPGVSAPWNPPGGGNLLPAFSNGALIFNLGNPIWRTYSVDTNVAANSYKLQVSEIFGALAPGSNPFVHLVDDIVDMQAQYGRDTNDDGAVETWDTNTPTTAAGWTQVLAVRIGILARSGNWERPSTPGGPCEATTALPSWSGFDESGAAGDRFTIPGGLPSCYKYRVFEVTVPLRNMIWRPA